MSLNDVILDHESNQCLFVCTKCGAEYVTRDMLAMHMMDSARAGMCIETDATTNASNVNNSTNHKITLCEDLVDSDKLITQKHDGISNNFNPSSYRSSLSGWIGERTEPIFNILFNQLTLPNLYSIQNSTTNNNSNNSNDTTSFHTSPKNRRFLSGYEGNIPSFRGCQINQDNSSSYIDIQKSECLHNLLLNSKYPTSNIPPNIKMNLIRSLKVNETNVFPKSTIKDSVRNMNEKSNSNDYKIKMKNVPSEVVTSQTSTSSVYSFIKSLNGCNAISTSNRDISKSLNFSSGTSLTNEDQKFINNIQCKSHRENQDVNSQESLKIAILDSNVKCIENHKVSKGSELFEDVKRYEIIDQPLTIKRSRSLPSPRGLGNQQRNCEMNYSVLEGNNRFLNASNMNNSDGVFHKTRRDRRCYKKSGFRNLRKFVNYNRSKLNILKNSHFVSEIHHDKAGMNSNCYNDRETDTNIHNNNLNEMNSQNTSKVEHFRPIFPYICEYCQIGFVQQALYCLHMGMHCVNNPLKCNMCAQTCLDVYDFIGHTMHF
ncbi:unnamed protein product [Schistosoma curassoni]|nr:unnamed protein product [Schistosoma curassoni]